MAFLPGLFIQLEPYLGGCLWLFAQLVGFGIAETRNVAHFKGFYYL